LGTMVTLRLGAILAMMIVPVRAADFSAAGPLSPQRLLHRVTVFSDDPKTIHDPRHPQSQTGEDKLFAPIGLVRTNHGVPHQYGPRSALLRDMGTGFLVSPCYVLTDYHVVFGNQFSEPDAGRDYSTTFIVQGKKSRAVPAKHGEYDRQERADWALLLLDSDAEHRCLGEDPNIGWVRLAPLSSNDAIARSLSVAGYPSDRSVSSLWRQDTCHLFQQRSDRELQGLWMTDCATRSRASGSPIFFVQNGVLNVVAIMQGHLGSEDGSEVLPKWDPNRANLAVDVGEIISSNPDFLKLIELDIDRFHQSHPAQARRRLNR
jgi:V8-like Glu-specific endopeptidase